MKISIEPRLDEFDYSLPHGLIAYHPASERDSSRMLVLDRRSGECEVRSFKDLPEYMEKGDCAVRNNSKVIKARIFAAPPEAPEKSTEFFLVEPLNGEKTKWSVLARPGRNLKKFQIFQAISPDGRKLPDLTFEIISRIPDLAVKVSSEADIAKNLDDHGHIPLPPYIKRPDESSDQERYQTVYAEEPGSVAAPTAGLHFTDEVFAKFAEKGVDIADVTLHVGIGTFRPVRSERISEHRMHSEHFSIGWENAEKINRARAAGGRVLAIGTTSLRALETSISPDGRIKPGDGRTDIFIHPPYRIKSADMLLTNFHLPKSTLLMLVCAFAGTDKTMKAYQIAIKEQFRFYSYGDCMLVK